MSSRILPEFELLMPQNIPEAVGMLAKHQEKAMVMAGGTDLLVLMKDGLRSDYVISLAAIPDLNYVRYDPVEGLRIGAMATLADVVDTAEVQKNYLALWKSAAVNGSPQTRHMGTVVGNLLRASPAGDCCCAVLALGGKVLLEGPAGSREVDIDDFWLDYRVTARKPDELAVEIILPPPIDGRTSTFMCLNRTTFDLAKVNVAVRLDMSANTCQHVRLAMGAVAPTPLRLRNTEALLNSAEITEEVLQQVAGTVATEISPIDDVRSSAEYRSQVAGVLVKRAIQEAWQAI